MEELLEHYEILIEVPAFSHPGYHRAKRNPYLNDLPRQLKTFKLRKFVLRNSLHDSL